MVPPLRKTVWWLLKKLNIELPRDPAISLPGMYPKELKMGIHIHTDTCMLTAAPPQQAEGRHNSDVRRSVNGKRDWPLPRGKSIRPERNDVMSYARGLRTLH